QALSEQLDEGLGATARALLPDAVVARREGRDLRQVGHAQDLVTARDLREPPAHRLGGAPADARIDLVEDQRPRAVVAAAERFQRQADPRQLAAGGDPGERSELLARVG